MTSSNSDSWAAYKERCYEAHIFAGMAAERERDREAEILAAKGEEAIYAYEAETQSIRDRWEATGIRPLESTTKWPDSRDKITNQAWKLLEKQRS